MPKTKQARDATGEAGNAGRHPDAVGEDPQVTPKQRRALDRLRQRLERDLDRFIEKVVNDKPSEFTDEDGWRHLVVYGQSTRACAEEIEGEVLLRVESLVMPLPADRELIVPLMREALEFNLMTIGSAKFAIAGRRLLAAATRPGDQVAPDDIEACLDDAGLIASLGAERFTRRFGGTTKKRQRVKDGGLSERRRAGVKR